MNPTYYLPHTSYFLLELSRFPELSRGSNLFSPRLSCPGQCHNKIPWLSRGSNLFSPRLSCPGQCHNKIPWLSRTSMNPVQNTLWNWWSHKAYKHALTSILAVSTGSWVPPAAAALHLSCIRSLISVVPSSRLYAQYLMLGVISSTRWRYMPRCSSENAPASFSYMVLHQVKSEWNSVKAPCQGRGTLYNIAA